METMSKLARMTSCGRTVRSIFRIVSPVSLRKDGCFLTSGSRQKSINSKAFSSGVPQPDVMGRQIHFVFTWGDIFLCIFGSMKKTGVLNCWLSYWSRYSASARSICLALYISPTSSCNISAVSFVLSYSSFM